MSELVDKSRDELSEADLARLEEYEHSNGPLSVLQRAIEDGTQILVSLRNNKKLLARVKAYDRHMNMVLINVKETWTERNTSSSGKKGKLVEKDRFISKMFLRGDGVVLVVSV